MKRRGNRLGTSEPGGLGTYLAALVIGLIAISPVSALGYHVRYTDAGEVVRWDRDRVRVRLDASLADLGEEDEVFEAIIRAMETWEDSGLLPPDLTFSVVEGARYGYSAGGPNHNDVVALTGEWPFDAEHAAVTIMTHDSVTGEILDADIVFNADRDWSTADGPVPGRLDLMDVTTHETGHLLGLGHSDLPTATMYPEGPPGSIERRSLHTDDLNALTATYGPPPALGRTPTGCSAAGHHPAEAPALPILLVLLLAVARLKPRRSPSDAGE